MMGVCLITVKQRTGEPSRSLTTFWAVGTRALRNGKGPCPGCQTSAPPTVTAPGSARIRTSYRLGTWRLSQSGLPCVLSSEASKDLEAGERAVRGRELFSVAALALAVALGGCSGPSAPTPAPTSYSVDAAPDHAILRVDVSGFFTPDGLPVLVLYGDGRVLSNPRGDYVFVPPLLRELAQTHVDSSEIQTILAAADRAGLMGADAHYEADITDANETSYVITVGGVAHKVSSYGGGGPPGPDQDARARLDRFYDQVFRHLDVLLGRHLEWSSYEPTAIEVTVQAPWNWPGPTAGEPALTWPLATDPATAADRTPSTPRRGCMVVTGSDAATFAHAVSGASAGSVWMAPSGPWELTARPVIPGAVPCGGW